ncbi:TPA: IS1380 family transposase, partial [Klebsiella pneumoniae]|nr:IS1380 family transposase [Klebsiella pneumoniae]HCT4234698.1 IS1380 family transposase [Klebsiella pneumoniae]HEA4686348.1 IS1380 family transposase [Escherichia coli]
DKFITTDYLQQCRLKYVFLAAKIIKTARYVIMKLSENYPYKGVYEKCLV